MNPVVRWRPTIAFVAALVLWTPTANAFVHGNLDVAPTGMRFVIALAVAWIGVTVLAMVVGGYGHHHVEGSKPIEPEDGTLDE